MNMIRYIDAVYILLFSKQNYLDFMTTEEFQDSLRFKFRSWYPDKEIRQNKIRLIVCQRERFREILKSTGRAGIDELLEFLDQCGFYYRPSSAVSHHNYPGGLLEHSLGVYGKMQQSSIQDSYDESIKIVGLLHDVYKCDMFYFAGWKIRKHSRVGRGSRSVRILKKFGIRLSPEEYRAIRFHMRGIDMHTDALAAGLVKADRHDSAEACARLGKND